MNTKRTAMNARQLNPLPTGTVMAALLILASSTTALGQVSGSKVINWEFRTANIGGVRGIYSLVSEAYSKGKHGGTGWVKSPLLNRPWPVALGTPGLITNPITNSTEGHATGMSDSQFRALAAVVISHPLQRPPTYSVIAETNVTGSATVETPHDGRAKANHKAKASAKLAGARAKGWTLRGTINGLNLQTQQGSGAPMGAINHRGWSIHDPVVLTLREVETGKVWSQELFAIDITSESADGTAVTWSYDDSAGISLNVDGPDGFASISGSASSPWLLNSGGDFGASLVDGVFTATGIWADLPWQLSTNRGAVTSASLAPEFMTNNLDYMVPDDLINDDYTYVQTLAWNESTDGFAEVVPTPGTVTFAVVAGLAALRRRRR